MEVLSFCIIRYRRGKLLVWNYVFSVRSNKRVFCFVIISKRSEKKFQPNFRPALDRSSCLTTTKDKQKVEWELICQAQLNIRIREVPWRHNYLFFLINHTCKWATIKSLKDFVPHALDVHVLRMVNYFFKTASLFS